MLEAIDLDTVRSHGYGFQVELTQRALRRGFTVREVPIVFHDRLHGHSKMSPWIALEAIVVLPQLRFARDGGAAARARWRRLAALAAVAPRRGGRSRDRAGAPMGRR